MTMYDYQISVLAFLVCGVVMEVVLGLSIVELLTLIWKNLDRR